MDEPNGFQCICPEPFIGLYCQTLNGTELSSSTGESVTPSDDSSSSLSSGAIAGIVVGSIAGVALIGLAYYYLAGSGAAVGAGGSGGGIPLEEIPASEREFFERKTTRRNQKSPGKPPSLL